VFFTKRVSFDVRAKKFNSESVSAGLQVRF